MRRRFLAAALSIAVATGLFATPARASQAHVLRFAEGLGVSTLNPFLGFVASTRDLSTLTMAHFVRIGPHGEFIPELIREIPTLKNGGLRDGGKTIVYHLRRGALWSDGKPFDADDVAYTLRVVKDKNNPIVIHQVWDRLVSFDEPDKFTIVMHLDRPYVPFVDAVFSSNSLSCILPQHVLGSSTNISTSPYNALPVGIGPFRYTAFRRGDAIEMEANPYYFGRKPKLQKIVYQLVTDGNTIFNELQTGELDLWGTVDPNFAPRFGDASRFATELVPSPYMGGIFFQTDSHSPSADPAVRKALRLATDRKLLYATVSHGLGVLAESVVAPSSLDHVDLPRAPFDPEGAKGMLDAAGWKAGSDGIRSKDGTRLALVISYPSGYAPSATEALVLRQEWAAVGVDASAKAIDDTQYFAPASAGGTLLSGNYDIGLLSLSSPIFADVSDTFSCSSRAPHGGNLTRYCNATVDRAMDGYTRTFDPAARAAFARTIQQTIDGDCPTIVVYARSFLYAHVRALTGFHPQAFAPYDAIEDADVNP